jgi:hypothetical protein
MKKNISIGIVLLLGLLIVGKSGLSAQSTNRPFLIEIGLGDSIYRPGSKITLPANTPEIRVQIRTVGGNPESRFIAKKLVYSSPKNVGSATPIASFNIPEAQGNNFPISLVSPRQSTTYTIEGITEIRGSKSKTWNIPLRERSFTIE